jgi:hypothetical protein
MRTAEWLSVIALIISSGGLAIQLRNWAMGKPRLHLSAMSDASVFPDDGKGSRAALTVINRGGEPTFLTHMIAFTYENRWKKLRKKPSMTGIVNSPHIPAKLEVNATWMGTMFYTDDLRQNMKEGKVYIGVIASHSSKNFLIRLKPPKETEVPTKSVASGN